MPSSPSQLGSLQRSLPSPLLCPAAAAASGGSEEGARGGCGRAMRARTPPPPPQSPSWAKEIPGWLPRALAPLGGKSDAAQPHLDSASNGPQVN